MHSFDAFRRYIRRRNIYLDARIIADVRKQLVTDGLACYMEEARFSDGVVWPSGMKLHQFLETFFVLVKRHGRLQSVEIATTIGNHYRIILQALIAASISLRTLKLHPYGSDGAARLSNHYDLLNNTSSRLASLLKQLKEFSWSFHWYPAAVEGNSVGTLIQVDNATVINGFVALMPQVEKLSLSWFGRTSCEDSLREPEALYFDFTYEAILALPKLHDFCLHGAIVSPNTLLRFLTTAIAKKISLRTLRLRTGTWDSILAVLNSGRFIYVHIENLYELRHQKYKLIFFNPIGFSKFGRDCNNEGDEVSKREDDTPTPLEYSTSYWLLSGATGLTITRHKGKAIVALG